MWRFQSNDWVLNIFLFLCTALQLKRKYTAGNVMLDKHTFLVAVLPNVDQAFIATLVIIMDRIKED